jgi:hypothetical protein
MTATTQQAAIDLMPQLRDLFDLASSLDLPRLARVEFGANADDPGWTVRAQLPTMTDAAEWDALLAWGHGVTPMLGDAHPASYMPSGSYRKASVTVVVAEVSIEVWAHVDGDFTPPEPVIHMDYGDAPFSLPGWRQTACGPDLPDSEVTTRMGEVTCPGCMDAVDAGRTSPVHAVGSFAALLLTDEQVLWAAEALRGGESE